MAKPVFGINGTPSHITYLGLKDGEEKRHRSRCVYFRSDVYCLKLSRKCTGSSHCSYYKVSSGEEDSGSNPAVNSAKESLPSLHDPKHAKIASFSPGQHVFHKKYGYGTIVSISSDSKKITIDFEEEGEKMLDFHACITYKLLYH